MHFKLKDGAELYYETHGSGPPLFLVAGLGGDGRWWGDNIVSLARCFTVIVHDHRGTGRSTLSKIAYSVGQMADDARQLIEGLGYDKVHWCGHSTGGAMGQVLARNLQEGLQGGTTPQAPQAAIAVKPDDVMATLEKLGELKAKGIVTQEEFDAKKAELLKKLV